VCVPVCVCVCDCVCVCVHAPVWARACVVLAVARRPIGSRCAVCVCASRTRPILPRPAPTPPLIPHTLHTSTLACDVYMRVCMRVCARVTLAGARRFLCRRFTSCRRCAPRISPVRTRRRFRFACAARAVCRRPLAPVLSAIDVCARVCVMYVCVCVRVRLRVCVCKVAGGRGCERVRARGGCLARA